MTGVDSELHLTWELHLGQIFRLNLHKDIRTIFLQNFRFDHKSRHEPRSVAFAVVVAYSMAAAWWFEPILRTTSVSDSGGRSI